LDKGTGNQKQNTVKLVNASAFAGTYFPFVAEAILDECFALNSPVENSFRLAPNVSYLKLRTS
jgi:hypothetical protein